MNCKTFITLLPRYPDDLPEETRGALLMHAAECPGCAALLAEQEALLASLETMDDDIEAPQAFASGWRDAIRTEEGARRAPWYARWQSWTAAAAVMAMVICGTSLMRGGKLFPQAQLSQSTGDTVASDTLSRKSLNLQAMEAPAAGAYPGEDAGVYIEEEAGAAPEANAQQPILLRSVSLTMDSTRFDDDLQSITGLLEDMQGWVEYQSVYGEAIAANPEAGRSAYLRLRVPEAALDAFVEAAGGIGKVTGQERSTEDISSSYFDTQGRLEMYAAQRDRMTELLARAEDMADIIEIEARLSELQYTIESLTGRLNRWDSRAANAEVTITLAEVAPEGSHARIPFAQRVRESFEGSLLSLRAFLSDMLVFLVMAAPYILCLAAAVFIGGWIFKAIKHKKHNKEK